MRYFLLGLIALSFVFVSVSPVAAKDEWLQVRSKNFNLVGNASEKDIRKVATRLEQFRETFRLLFRSASINSPIPTNVVVFKSDSAFKPFKPKRADGKADTGVAGYFQPGPDANYIAVSTEREDADTFGTIYHEYVHFVIDSTFGKADVPPWFNEGFAEYYQTYQIEEDQKIKLGLAQSEHLFLLQNTRLIPLDQLFQLTDRQVHGSGDQSRSIFYAQSWALIHYLMATGKAAALDTFLAAVLKGTPQEKAFRDAFQMDYLQMEQELRKYVEKRSFQYTVYTLKQKLTFDAEMQVSSVGEAAMNAWLGDLLYHTNRADDAEPYLQSALKLDAESSLANVALAMVKVRQRKFDEAKPYFEKATALDPKNHIAYYSYAYLLSREAMDEFGYVRSFPAASADKMRALLSKAIALRPAYIDSYELMAFVNLVNNEKLDESMALLKTALKHQPGNERCIVRAAEILLQQDKLDDAATLAQKLAERTADEEVKARADNIVTRVNQKRDFDKRMAEAQKQGGRSMAPMMRRTSEPPMSEAEMKKLQAEAENRSINQSLREPKEGEKRVVGSVEKVTCKGKAIMYLVKTTETTLTLTSKDFQGLEIIAYVPGSEQASVGCGTADLASINTVITYREAAPTGELLALEFVPAAFRLMTRQELNEPPARAAPTSAAPDPSGTGDMDAARRAAMMDAIRNAARQPAAGERRELAYLEKIECTPKGAFFVMKAAGQTLRLSNPNPAALQIKLFTPELAGMRFECGASVPDFPALVVFKNAPDPKQKTAGEIVSLEFVPKTFTLE
jgi:predicted Zn-dependent protease